MIVAVMLCDNDLEKIKMTRHYLQNIKMDGKQIDSLLETFDEEKSRFTIVNALTKENCAKITEYWPSIIQKFESDVYKVLCMKRFKEINAIELLDLELIKNLVNKTQSEYYKIRMMVIYFDALEKNILPEEAKNLLKMIDFKSLYFLEVFKSSS